MQNKNAVFWDMTQCGSYKNRRFGGIYRLQYQGEKNRQAKNNVSSIRQLKDVSQTSVLTSATWRHTRSHRHENLKSYLTVKAKRYMVRNGWRERDKHYCDPIPAGRRVPQIQHCHVLY
jgi:hypothetical protein